MIVLVPAYEPDRRLVTLVDLLRAAAPDLHVLVVDDGSGPTFAAEFDAVRTAGAEVLVHERNHGKGRALRTGFAHALEHHPGQDVVCADCDGQHGVVDILRVADRVRHTGAIVLGARRFTGRVPLRSRVGNAVTRNAFRLVTRTPLTDTQTGLRGYPAAELPWLLTVPGDRFEYEITLLLHATASGRPTEEVEIATIYLDGNASSHFRPVVDSLRVYVPLVRFTASSLLAAAVDAALLLVLHALTGALLPSVLLARAASGSLNFLTNRSVVFGRGRTPAPLVSSALRYTALAAALVAANYVVLVVLTGVGLGLLAAKVITEVTLFLVSYHVQRRAVFAGRRPHGATREGTHEPALSGPPADARGSSCFPAGS